MASSFIRRFIASISTQRKINYLEMVRQKKDETLREYVTRFNAEALQIPNLDEPKAVEAMQKETTSVEFFGSLSRKSLTTLVELMQRVKKYIRQDDTLMTSQFAREPQEKDQMKSQPEDQRKEQVDRRKEQVDRRPDQSAEALNRYRESKEADRRPRPPPHRDITP